MANQKRFENKVALVTGGSSGIGHATALALAREGAKTVIVADINIKALEETVESSRKANLAVESMQLDISKAANVERMIKDILDQHGRLDCAVNSAGIEGDMMPTHECSEENWNRVIDVNLKGVWLSMKYELLAMLPKGSGSIVNVSSTSGVGGLPRWPAYSAAKHGILGLTKTAALEYAKTGIRINAVCPGAIQTPLLDRIIEREPSIKDLYIQLEPVGRLGTPEEVAESILWLLSDSASFVTGHALHVDGGFLAF
jgi:NAD(P)-dependent dehydrogenase (short-subunit alcohol dehydrogenase family)